MNETEIIIRVILGHIYLYANTTMIDFSEEFINEIVPKLNDLFIKNGYKADAFIKDKQSKEYKNFKKLMFIIFDDTLYPSDKIISKNSFGLYDDENEVLDMIRLSFSEALKWDNYIDDYGQDFIEEASYVFTKKFDVYESERKRFEENYKSLFQ